MSLPSRPRQGHFTEAALGITLLVLVIQLYLFETVLQSVLDGHRTLLAGAFIASLALTVVALVLAFKAPCLDDDPGA
ncbi:DUF6755 family protein [Geothrix paludis]|uniref:DUF6755 family protein n=1 Tax=Geothrix paludis TaxID=2922722 RepID=UPI001FABBC24|nr:DUF6755 family protein [Geothrix paludis]